MIFFCDIVHDWWHELGIRFITSSYYFDITLGVVHKLRWQDFGFFDHLPPCVDILYGMNVDKKWTFFDHLPTSNLPWPTSSCKRSLWTNPYFIFLNSSETILKPILFILGFVSYVPVQSGAISIKWVLTSLATWPPTLLLKKRRQILVSMKYFYPLWQLAFLPTIVSRYIFAH